ncbi:hypothetical protein ALI144C_12615 [Actinosynnema sp. ALI-1.44]|uniref:DUF397 domain-containing protein n=1 Tax=Actinosynnema sp. ALI-1.44 TaxID=1933779 RepID=UPI00097BED5C|nr:DUF397 domain-containing protein [Actinosynnema sp. ALI-1.44]ONI85940.1 hypothetical protein ALI144C_12615 [Actinosynnema sp. ALI-1.44]
MEWRKSSFSGTGGNCVEVRSDLAAIRDSKVPDGSELVVDVTSLLSIIKTQ